MFVDGKGPFIGENEGKYFGLDLTEPLFLGGVPNYDNISPEVDIDTGLVGKCLTTTLKVCIKKVCFNLTRLH